jgi:hypothetical protein
MLRGASLLACALLACESGYAAPPTPCDEWCLATQRAGCADDWPHECVGSCATFFYPEVVSAGCEAEWRELVGCYLRASDADFFCRADVSTPGSEVCAIEQSGLGRCLNEVWQSCVDACLALTLTCEAFDQAACSRWCVSLPDTCLAAVTYHDCLIENAARCDFLAPECAESRAVAVRCPAELVPEDAGTGP